MTTILFLGYSNLLKNRIIPILNRLDISSISIAKFEGQEWDEQYKQISIPVTLYDCYEDGLEQFRGDIVYISTVNSTHYTYAKRSLTQGFHTIIDKPATLCLSEAVNLLNIAKQKKLLLSESTVYLHHPQIQQIVSIFHQYNDYPKLLTVHFSMPPFRENNFRYKKELGGGAILDTAPYAVSIGRYFFNDFPLLAATIIHETSESGLEIEYSLEMKYPGGKCLIGHFGFNTEYINQVILIGNHTNVLLNRIFTTPENMENEIIVTHENTIIQKKSVSANSFELYFKDVLKRLQNMEFQDLYLSMIADAKARDLITNNII